MGHRYGCGVYCTAQMMTQTVEKGVVAGYNHLTHAQSHPSGQTGPLTWRPAVLGSEPSWQWRIQKCLNDNILGIVEKRRIKSGCRLTSYRSDGSRHEAGSGVWGSVHGKGYFWGQI